ncbi:hypothetical protein FHL15_010611 [Xylaria flabelliformis]|uniref:HMG box domain-containing protein n=1 Tax=Xylaria flabelliformis TaxID=2512241 RepID=A0A553HKL7_9PEZI|nr:hypothetical protein FHL15_010611 [Xylaria flabelliformis]
MPTAYGKRYDMVMALWTRLSTQINGYATTIRLTAADFDTLRDDGEKLFLYHSMRLTRKPTEFIADASDPNVVFLGDPQELEHTMSSIVTRFPGSRLRMLWRPVKGRVDWTNIAIPATTTVNTTSVTDSGNVPGFVNFPNHGNIQTPYGPEDVAGQFSYNSWNFHQSVNFQSIVPLRSQLEDDLSGAGPSVSRKRKAPIDAQQSNATGYDPVGSRAEQGIGSDPDYGHVDDRDIKPKSKRQKSQNPKPMNAFFLFRQHYTRHEKFRHQTDISGEVSKIWSSMSEEEKEPWKQKARELSKERKEMRLGLRQKKQSTEDFKEQYLQNSSISHDQHNEAHEPHHEGVTEGQNTQYDITATFNIYEIDPYLSSIIDAESASQESAI